MTKSKTQKAAEKAVKKAGGRRIFGAPRGGGRFSAVKAVKQEKKKGEGK